MTTTATDHDVRLCRCGCGERVTKAGSRYLRGHWAKQQKANRDLELLPGPDDDIDVGEAEPLADEDGPAADDQIPQWVLDGADGPPPGSDEDDRPVRQASQPGHLSAPRAGRQAGKPRTAKVRVTATVRKDVQAKIRFVLLPAANVWKVRDPICGSVFEAQEPDISEALAELVCDSADLLAWFTGPAGGFMKYFKLLMAVQPVAMAVWAHHVAHAEFQFVGGDGQPVQQQPPAFAA